MSGNRIVKLSRFHVRLGLIFSVPLLLAGLSGIILGFYDPLRYGFPPYRLENPVSRPLHPTALAEAAHSAYPGARLEVLYLPTAPERAARAKLTGEEGSKLLFLDSGTGKPVAVRDAAERDLLGVLYEIHRGKVAGLAGEIFVAAVALSLLLLWLTGLPRRGRGRKAGTLHGRLGRGLGGGVAFIALTGVFLTFVHPLRDLLYSAPAAGATALPKLDAAGVITAGAAHYSAAPLERVVYPARDGQPVALRFRDGGRVWIDGAGTLLRRESPYSPWINLLYPLHSGRILGKWGPPLVAAFGGVLLYLVYSGYRLRQVRGKKAG